jgi:WD40 repeat protein
MLVRGKRSPRRQRPSALDIERLEAKISTEGVDATIALCRRLASRKPLAAVVAEALELSAFALSRQPRQLRAQLLARIPAGMSQVVDFYRDRIARAGDGAWLRPVRATLTPVGGPLVRTVPVDCLSLERIAVSQQCGVLITAGIERGKHHKNFAVVRLWDALTLRPEEAITAHPDDLSALAVAIDGLSIFTSGRDRTIRRWSLDSGKRLCDIPAPDLLKSLHPLPDGRRVLCAAWKQLFVLDIKTETIEHSHVLDKSCGGCAVSPDGRLAIIADWDGVLHALDISTWKSVWKSPGHPRHGTLMTVDRKHNRLLVNGKAISVLDLESGKRVARWDKESDMYSTALICHEDHAYLGANDGGLLCCRLSDGKPAAILREHDNRVEDIAVSADQKRIMTVSTDNTMKIWDLQRLQSPSPKPKQGDLIQQIALTAAGDRAVTISGHSLSLWAVSSGTLRRTVKSKTWMCGVAVLPDGQTLLTAHSDARLTLRNLGSGRIRSTHVNKNDEHYHAFVLIAHGTQAVTALHIDRGQDQAYALSLWNLKPLNHIGHGSAHAYSLAWSDDLQLGFSAKDGVPVWRREGPRVVVVDQLGGNGARAVAAIPGLDRILVARSEVLELWQLKPKRLIKSVGIAGADCIAANSARDVVVTGGHDGSIRLLRCGTLNTLAEILTEVAIKSCAITANGQYAIAGDEIGRVHFFSIE